MSLDWGKPEDAGDSARTRRLAGSYVAALVLVGAVLGIGVVFGGRIKKQVLEEEVTVKLVPPEPVKAPPAPPPPPPPPPPKAAIRHNPNPGPKGVAPEAPPTELPKGPPAEGDPNQAKAEEPIGDPNGVVGGTGRGGGMPAPTVVEPSVPPPPPPPTVQIAEVATPPIARSKSMPAYPDDARKQGIEALVVVKFVVTEDGRVEDVRIVRGHPLFDDVVLASVRAWTFDPATLDGRAVRMSRMVKIPFRLKHS